MTQRTQPRVRRARGSLDPASTSVIFARVDDSIKNVYVRMSEASGLSIAVVLARVAEHLSLDESGLPEWWPHDDVAQGSFDLIDHEEVQARRTA